MHGEEPNLKIPLVHRSIPSGQYSFSADDIFQGLVPCQLIVRLVASASYMGDYKRSPYYFRDYNCSTVGFYVDVQSYPSQPFQPNYEAEQYVDCYRMLTCFRKDINFKQNDYVKALTGKRHLDPIRYLPGNPQYRLLQIRVRLINERPLTHRYPLYIEKKNDTVL